MSDLSSSSSSKNANMYRYLEGVKPDCCLAQTMRISQVLDIPGADRIQAYVVGGWKCVAAKNAFKVGELVVYIRIGSVLDPEVSHWSFLEGYPLKTKKIRGVVSQGLIGPLDWISVYGMSEPLDYTLFPESISCPDGSFSVSNIPENFDVTKFLHVRKYVEPDEFNLYNSGSSSSSRSSSALIPRPTFIPKTDAERVQNITQQQWQELKGKTAWNTRKEDGTSATYWFNKEPDQSEHSDTQDSKSPSNGEFGICSRNYLIDREMKGQEHYKLMNQRFNIEHELRSLNRSLAIQGEIVGPKINGNRLQLIDYDFRVFGMWDISRRCYLDPQEVWELCQKMKLNNVPIISNLTIGENEMSSDFWLQQAESQKYNKNVQAEGIVFMVHDQLRHMRFKAISNNYLLKHNL